MIKSDETVVHLSALKPEDFTSIFVSLGATLRLIPVILEAMLKFHK